MTMSKENCSATCQCSNKNCCDCRCGCGPDCCSTKTATECPFIKAHPNWQKCPFMSKMFMMKPETDSQIAPVADEKMSHDHSKCDSSKCCEIPMTQCTSCHQNPALNHTVTLQTDTELATDQTEEIVM